ncbi:MAG: arginine--tRNA ligase [Bacillota bacterium]|nr:arginine--tRNA ligase [Bacillota bacterium]
MSVAMELKGRLSRAVAEALRRAAAAGELGGLAPEELPPVALEVPRERAHGDWSTNAAFLAGRAARRDPRQVAEALLRFLAAEGCYLQRVEVAGPGFINFYLDPAWLREVVRDVERSGLSYGRTEVGRGQRVQVEFVSANPTGPLHIGHGRGAAVGSALASALEWAGYEVSREFYINDAGNQIARFGESLDVRFRQALGEKVELPADGYHGQDLAELMRELAEREADRYLRLPPAERQEKLAAYAMAVKLEEIRRDLAAFGVAFDVWFPESRLHAEGAIQRVLELLRERGMTYEQDGALWLATTRFGDDKDRVLVRQNGIPTYFAADVAYHHNKMQRGFHQVIDVWGADHHGYIPRMKAAMAALGYDPAALDVVITQMVNLLREGKPVVMSKRAGQLVTLAEVVAEVGRDAARFLFLLRSADSHLDFDLELAKRQSDENPVYYAQYAHARISSLLRQAAEARVLERPPAQEETLLRAGLAADEGLDRLTHPTEVELCRLLADFPEEVVLAAQRREPHRLTRYVLDVAAAFHSFYTECRVLGSEPPLEKARLLLADATRVVLRNALQILGVRAPERM